MDVHITNNRADINYLSTLACSHVGKDSLGYPNDSESVRVVSGFDRIHGNIEDSTYDKKWGVKVNFENCEQLRLTGTVDTRVVHEDVYPALVVNNGLYGPLHSLIVCNIHLDFVNVRMFEFHGFQFTCRSIDDASLGCVFLTAAV